MILNNKFTKEKSSQGLRLFLFRRRHDPRVGALLPSSSSSWGAASAAAATTRTAARTATAKGAESGTAAATSATKRKRRGRSRRPSVLAGRERQRRKVRLNSVLNPMRQVLLECDITIAVNDMFLVCNHSLKCWYHALEAPASFTALAYRT